METTKLVYYSNETQAIKLYNEHKTSLLSTPHAYREFCECIDWERTSKDMNIEQLEHSIRSKAGRENRKSQPVTGEGDVKTIYVNGISDLKTSNKPVVYWSFKKNAKQLRKSCHRTNLECWRDLTGEVTPRFNEPYKVLVKGDKRLDLKKIYVDSTLDSPEANPIAAERIVISSSAQSIWHDMHQQVSTDLPKSPVEKSAIDSLIVAASKSKSFAQSINWIGKIPVILIPSNIVNFCAQAAENKIKVKRGTIEESFIGNVAEFGVWYLLIAINELMEAKTTITRPNFAVHPGGDIVDLKVDGIHIQSKFRTKPAYFASSRGNPERDIRPGQENDYFLVCSGEKPAKNQSYNLKICRVFHGYNEIDLATFIRVIFEKVNA